VSDIESGDRLYVVMVSVVAAVGGFLFGYDLAVVSGAIIFLQKQFALTTYQVGFAIGSAQIGCILAPFFASVVIDRFGRKRILLAAALLFAIAAMGTALPRNMTEFNVFRIVAGVAIGLASVVSPMYIAEISPAAIRGHLVLMNQFAIVIGAMSSYGVSYLFSFSGNWRAMFACAAIPALVLMIGLLFIPESPRWLAEKNRFEDALRIMGRIEGRTKAEKEIAAMHETVAAESGTWGELLGPGVRMALFVGLLPGVDWRHRCELLCPFDFPESEFIGRQQGHHGDVPAKCLFPGLYDASLVPGGRSGKEALAPCRAPLAWLQASEF
jgi:MFS family permease